MTPTLQLVRAVVLAGLLVSGPALAQATRTWVSGVGDDANPCSRTAPCKTFAGAISKTAAGGEIDVLDPGGYGAVTITKAITIDGNGFISSALVAGTNGIVISAGAADDIVLRNLSLEGVGPSPSPNAIRYLSGRSLTVENVTIRGFTRGISVDGAAGVTTDLRVRDSQLEANQTGIWLQPLQTTSTTFATLARVSLVNNGTGLRADSGAKFAMTGSTVSGNTTVGVHTVGPSGSAAATGYVEDSQISSNGVGVKSEQAASLVVLSRSSVSGNLIGLQAIAPGELRSFGNNQVVDNGDNGAFTGTVATR